MKQAIIGYWTLFRKKGLFNAIYAFYLYYYSKYKLKKIDRTKDNFVTTHGCKLLVIPTDEGISSELLVFGSHEPINIKFVSQKLKQGMTCLDVGANIGIYATLESKIVGDKGKVIAIEPSPINFRYLEHNLNLQNKNNFEAYNIATSNQEENLDFLIFNKKSNYCQVLRQGQEIPPETKVISVPTKRIDTLFKENPIDKLNLLRMDIEGHEWEAIQGAKDTIRKFKPMIKIEIHLSVIGSSTTKKIFDFFENNGYNSVYFISEKRDPAVRIKTKAGVKETSFEELYGKLEADELPLTMSLFIEKVDRLRK